MANSHMSVSWLARMILGRRHAPDRQEPTPQPVQQQPAP
jgi:hypothetical protein